MGVQERKEKERTIRFDEMVDAAERIFGEKGIEAATMDEIAREAEFSKRTIYAYFDSKEELILAVGIRGFKTLLTLFEGAAERSADRPGLEWVSRLGEEYFSFIRTSPLYFRIITDYQNREIDLDTESPVVRENYRLGEKCMEALVSALAKGQKDGSIRRNLDVTSTAITLWAMIVGMGELVLRKRVYLEDFHHLETEKLIGDALCLVMESLKNKEKK